MKPITKSLMKQLLTLTSVLAFAAAGVGVARASSPVLYNGDLNLIGPGPVANPSPLGWQVNGGLTYNNSFDDTCDSETFCNGADDPALSGYGLFLKPFQGSTNVIDNFCF